MEDPARYRSVVQPVPHLRGGTLGKPRPIARGSPDVGGSNAVPWTIHGGGSRASITHFPPIPAAPPTSVVERSQSIGHLGLRRCHVDLDAGGSGGPDFDRGDESREGAPLPHGEVGTPRDTEPEVIEITGRPHAHEVESRMADALSIGREAIVIGRINGARLMICRVRPADRGVLLIAKNANGTGLRRDARTALADALRLIAAEFDRHG